ncbi:MAG: fasciclin domain-containing protein [Deltaproteobacteria bacterium]|jgi:uncharacterized surface protein with fasciclin (FAS1) repeats|nr:MAG: fasciclin domain-containing protein [Deltaproteobacteria bacterium]
MKRTKTNILTIITVLLIGASLVGSVYAGNYGYGHKRPSDIVHTAIGAGSFNTLVAALQAADLTETLMTSGPYTVFAPTDEAFAQLPEGTLADLLKPENKAKLQKILTYHVVSGTLMAADVTKLNSAKTLEGQMITIDTSDGVKVDDANVVKTDILASNGVIHVIDRVIIPN